MRILIFGSVDQLGSSRQNPEHSVCISTQDEKGYNEGGQEDYECTVSNDVAFGVPVGCHLWTKQSFLRDVFHSVRQYLFMLLMLFSYARTLPIAFYLSAPFDYI